MNAPFISIFISLLTYLFSYIETSNGALTGGPGACGDFGFGCLGSAMLMGAVGWTVALCVALASFWKGDRSWEHWIALLLSALPLLPLAAFGLLVISH